MLFLWYGKVYANWDTVKMPLLLYLVRSFPVRLERRLRSSLPTESFLHRSWNPHSGQCRLTTVSGGVAADSRDANSRETILCTTRDNAGRSPKTSSVCRRAQFSPCRSSCPMSSRGQSPRTRPWFCRQRTTCCSPRNGSAQIRTVSPPAGYAGSERSPASQPWVCKVSPTANCQDSRFPQTGVLKTRCTGPTLGRLASEWPHAGRIPPSRRPMMSIRCPLGVLPQIGDGI